MYLKECLHIINIHYLSGQSPKSICCSDEWKVLNNNNLYLSEFSWDYQFEHNIIVDSNGSFSFPKKGGVLNSIVFFC